MKSRYLILGTIALLIGVCIGFSFRTNEVAIAPKEKPVVAPTLNLSENASKVVIEAPNKLLVETKDVSNGKSVGQMQGGKKQGVWVFYHENKKTESTGAFVDDVKVGKWQYYYKDGTLQSLGEYDQLGQKINQWDSYYENGNPRSRGIYKANIRVGTWYDWPDSQKDKMFWVGQFTNDGVRNGEFILYSNGVASFKEMYVNGQLVNRTNISNSKNSTFNRPFRR